MLGVTLLKSHIVDGEDWDLLSVWSGTYGIDAQRAREAKVETPERLAARVDQKRLEARRRLDAYLEIDQPHEALAVRRRMLDLGTPLELDRNDLLRLITGLHKHRRWAESAPIMAELLERFPDNSQLVRLKLAQICLMELEKPGRALDLLDGLDGATLPEPQEKLRRKIKSVAKQRVAEGELEVDDGVW